MGDPSALYAAFGRPSSTTARALADRAEGSVVVVAGENDIDVGVPGVELVHFACGRGTMFERGAAYGRRLTALIRRIEDGLDLAQFRDLWSGVPILAARLRCPAIYEVAELASDALVARRPWTPESTIARLRAAEDYCLRRADFVLTSSFALAEQARRRGAPGSRVSVVPRAPALLRRAALHAFYDRAGAFAAA
jgi:hypothetical protein